MNMHTTIADPRSKATVKICGITVDEIEHVCDECGTTHQKVLSGSLSLAAKMARRRLILMCLRRAPHLTVAYIGRALTGASTKATSEHVIAAIPLVKETIMDGEYLRGFPVEARKTVIEVSAKHGMPVGIMLSTQNKTRPVVNARQELVWRLKTENPNRSFPQIAAWFEQDHTTMLNSFRAHSRRVAWQERQHD